MVDTIYVVLEQKTRGQNIPDSEAVAVYRTPGRANRFIDKMEGTSRFSGKLVYQSVDVPSGDFPSPDESDE